MPREALGISARRTTLLGRVSKRKVQDAGGVLTVVRSWRLGREGNAKLLMPWAFLGAREARLCRSVRPILRSRPSLAGSCFHGSIVSLWVAVI